MVTFKFFMCCSIVNNNLNNDLSCPSFKHNVRTTYTATYFSKAHSIRRTFDINANRRIIKHRLLSLIFSSMYIDKKVSSLLESSGARYFSIWTILAVTGLPGGITCIDFFIFSSCGSGSVLALWGSCLLSLWLAFHTIRYLTTSSLPSWAATKSGVHPKWVHILMSAPSLKRNFTMGRWPRREAR